MDVLTISLGRNILVQGSREFLRMQSYAAQLSTFHIVVLTRKSHGFIHAVHDLKLHVYPTNSSSRVMMLVDAFLIGRQIARARREGTLVITAQDPLEIGWVCWLLSFIKNTRLHIQVHGDYFSSGAWVGGSLLRYIRRIFAYVLLTRAPTIRVVSKRIADSLIQKGIKRDRLTILPIRPEIETFFNVERIPRTVPPYTFLYVGRLAPEKDIPRILYAFAELQKKTQRYQPTDRR